MLQQKWLAKLLGMNYEIVYKKGKNNKVADALSRLPEVNGDVQLNAISSVQCHWLHEVTNSYNQDSCAQNAINNLIAGAQNHTAWQLQQWVLKYHGKIYVGSQGEIRDKILRELHDGTAGGHSGHEATLRRVQQFFYWSTIKRDVVKYVHECDICQRIKTGNQFPGGLLQPLPVPTQIWEDIPLDFVEGLPKSHSKDCIMVVVDMFTKVGHFIALTHPFNAAQVAQIFLDNIYKLHGMPKSIVSDRDKLFISQFWIELFNSLGTQLKLSTAYHPQSDGQTERLNRCLEQYLRAMASSRPKNWSRWLPLVQWWYNTTYHSAIRRSPYEALYGVRQRQICIPADHRSNVDLMEDFQIQREAMNKVSIKLCIG